MADSSEESSLRDQIQQLQLALDERNEENFDLQISVSSANAELQHGLEKLRDESQQTIRRLEEELRRLRHENHRMQTNKRKTISTTEVITPTHPGKSRSTHHTDQNNIEANASIQHEHHTNIPTPIKSTISTISSTHRILMQISPLVNPNMAQRLWLAPTELDLTQLLMEHDEWELVLAVLQSSPASCRYLVRRTEPAESLLTIGGTSIDFDQVDLQSRLWTPTTQIAPTKNVTEPNDSVNVLWETAARSPERVAVWNILRYLLRYYKLPFPEQQQISILEKLIRIGRQCTVPARRLGFDDDDEYKDIIIETSSRPPDWIGAAISCLEAFACRADASSDLKSKSWSTWFAVLLDMAEQHDDAKLRLPIVRWLRRLTTNALDVYLRVEIVTSDTTAELWHRAPSAIHVVCSIWSNAVSDEINGASDLFRTEPSVLIVESIRFFYAIVLAVQEARRQEQSLALWDVAPAELLAANAALILERTQDEELQRMLATILDELEEDYSER